MRARDREFAQQTRGIDRPNFVKPETGHPRSTGVPSPRRRTTAREPIDQKTATPTSSGRINDRREHDAIMGSSVQLRYGTVDPIPSSRISRSSAGGPHVDGAWAGSSSRGGQELGYDIPLFDFLRSALRRLGTPTSTLRLQGLVGGLAFRDKRCATASTSS